ncbi:MAG: hypothetical protein JWP55_3598 [Mycobacterium sp.]|nr:hypothetical protein [Mycobacterium sp.]
MSREEEATNDDTPALTRLPWHWEWVPNVRPGEEKREVWTKHVVALFEDWTSEGVAAARLAGPEGEIEFPLASGMVGRAAAEWLLARAERLPEWSRLAWGAVFVAGGPHWAPIPVLVEFCQPVADDPNYLMEIVGATGLHGDARSPAVDYVTTPIGDGVRVFAMGRTPQGQAFGRLDAALRLDVPPGEGAPSVSTDVVLTTRVFELGLMALIGAGVEQLMQRIADDCAPGPDAGPARLGFVAVTEGEAP